MQYYLIPFCTKVIDTGHIGYLDKIPEFLIEDEPELKNFIEFVKDYHAKHGAMPDEARLSVEELDGFYSTKHKLYSSPITDLYAGFIEGLKREKLERIYAEHTVGNIVNFEEISKGVKILERITPHPISSMGVLDTWDDYDVDTTEGEYISSGFPNLDSVSGGMAKGDYLLIAAPTGTGKSTLLTYQAYRGLLSGLNTLYINKEERKVDIKRRMYAIAGQFNNFCFRNPTPSNINTINSHKPLVMKKMKELKGLGGNVWFPEKPVENIKDIAGILDDFKKRGISIDQVCVDNSYLWGGKNNDVDWRVIRANSIVLRGIALDYETRVVCTTQLTGGDNLAYSSQMKEDCSMMVFVKNEDKGSTMSMRIISASIEKNRYAAQGNKAPIMLLKLNYENSSMVMENDIKGKNLLELPL